MNPASKRLHMGKLVATGLDSCMVLAAGLHRQPDYIVHIMIIGPLVGRS